MLGMREECDQRPKTLGQMNSSIPVGVWPTMITPFTDQDQLDFHALAAMVEWYVEHEVAGLFAVCQSSEMFFLSLEERVELARRCVEMAAGACR